MATPARQTDPQPSPPASGAEVIGVMDFSRVLTSDGRTIPLRPAALGDGAMYTFMLAWRCLQLGIAQLWIHPSWPGALDDDVPEHLTPTYGRWTIDSRQPHWRVCYCAGTYMPGGIVIASPAHDWRAPWRDATTADELLAALVRFRAVSGLAYVRSPGRTGVDLIRDVHGIARDGSRKPGAKGRPLRLDVPGTLPEPCANNAELPRQWIRPLFEGERRAKYLHSYDKNKMFLAACSSLALGMGEPVHTRPADATYDDLAHPRDAKTGKRLPTPPGFWRVHLNPDRFPVPRGFPSPLSISRRDVAQHWITTPTLALLDELHVEADCTEAYLWPEHHRALEPWYARLRDGFSALAQLRRDGEPGADIADAALKACYTVGIGYMARKADWVQEGDTLYRPDWRTFIIAQANAVVYRQGLKCVEAGYFPFACGTDCWYFVSDEPDAEAACPPALKLDPDKLGAWKVKDRAVPLADILPVLDAFPGALLPMQKALNAIREGKPLPTYPPEGDEDVPHDGH